MKRDWRFAINCFLRLWLSIGTNLLTYVENPKSLLKSCHLYQKHLRKYYEFYFLLLSYPNMTKIAIFMISEVLASLLIFFYSKHWFCDVFVPTPTPNTQIHFHTLISLINKGPRLTDFEKFHPPQNKNPPSTFIDFLDFSTLHFSFIRVMY